jgi:hypothetical protein
MATSVMDYSLSSRKRTTNFKAALLPVDSTTSILANLEKPGVTW